MSTSTNPYPTITNSFSKQQPNASSEVVDPDTGLYPEVTGVFTPSQGNRSTTADPTEYSKYFDQNVHTEFGQDYLDPLRAAEQSGAEQFGAFLNQAIVGEIIGGTIEGVGYLADIGDAYNLMVGKQADLGNAFTRAGASIRDFTKDVTPIYETSPGEFAPDKWSWWMSNGTSVASTVALMIPAAGAVKGIGMLGKAVGATKHLSKMGRAMGLTAADLSIIAKAAPGVTQAIVSRDVENLLEAHGKFEEIYDRNIKIGLSHEEASKIASEAASSIYRKNWAMLAQDIPQYLLLGRSFGKASKGITSGLEKELGSSALKAGLKKTQKYLLTGASEGFEEAYQYAVSESADELAKAKVDPNYTPRHLGKLIQDEEMWTSAAMGAFGGMAFQGIGGAVQKGFGLDSEEDNRIQNVKSHAPTIRLYSETMRGAEERGDVDAYEQARLGLINELAGKAAMAGNIDVLKQNLTQMMEQSSEDESAAEYNLDKADVEYMQKTFPALMEDVDAIGEAYEKYASGKVDNTVYDSDIAATLAGLETAKGRLYTRKQDLQDKLARAETDLNKVGWNDMSQTGKELVRIENDITAYTKLNKFAKEQLKKTELDEDSKDFYRTQSNTLDELITALRDRKKTKRKSDDYSKEDRAKDAKINLDSALLNDVINTNTALKYVDQSLNKHEDTVKFIKDTQKGRNDGTKTVPQEPDNTPEQIEEPEETVDTTVQEGTDKTPEVVVEEKKTYKPDPKDVARRRKNNNPETIQNYLKLAGDAPLSKLFDDFESADAVYKDQANTGLVKKEGDKLYFYEDNAGVKVDISHLLNTPMFKSGLAFIGEPNPYTSMDVAKDQKEESQEDMSTNEIEATRDLTPQVEHPTSDDEIAARPEVKRDFELQGEERVYYNFTGNKELVDYINDSSNDMSDVVGEFFVDKDYTDKDGNKPGDVLKGRNSNPAQKADIERRRQEELDSKDKIFLHGSATKISKFDKSKRGSNAGRNAKIGDDTESGVFLTDDTETAEIYSDLATEDGESGHVNKVKVNLKASEIYNVDFEGKAHSAEKTKSAIKEAKEKGYKAVAFNNIFDGGELSTSLLVFDESNLEVVEDGEVIDYNKINAKYDAELADLGQSFSIDSLTEEELDSIPIGIKLSTPNKTLEGALYLPKSTTVPIGTGNEAESIIANNRAYRYNVLDIIASGNKATTKGFRKDAGHTYSIPKKGAKNKVYSALNTDYKDIRLGVAVDGGSVRDRNDKPMPFFGNPYGGNVFVITNQTPSGEDVGIKLNKVKVTDVHANIILNAFEQSTKSGGWKQKYTGPGVEGDISLGSLLSLLVLNGNDTIVTEGQKKAIRESGKPDSAEYILRLEKNRLNRQGKYLHYGVKGRINLDAITPEDRKAFITHATEAYNYPISLGRFTDEVPTITIGSMKLEKGMTFEQHYVKNGLLTTDTVLNEYGNVKSTPNVYISINEESITEVKEDKQDDTPTEGPKPLDDFLSDFRGFSSKFTGTEKYDQTDVDKQIEQIRSIVGENVSVEVTDDLISVIDETGSHLAFGQVKDGSIKLYKQAESGTGYHEAFHIVSLYYLTGRQRKRVYDDASRHFNIDRTNERAIEEALAEAFREYMLTDGLAAPKVKSVRTFFQKLYDFIMDLFVRPESKVSDLSMDQLFNKMENGAFKAAKIRNKNFRKYNGYDYLRKIEGFSTDQTHKITSLLMYQMLTKNNVVKLEDIGKLSLNPVIEYVKGVRKATDTFRSQEGLSDAQKQEGDRLYHLYSKILYSSPEAETKGKLDNFGEFASLIGDRLYAMNINRKPDVFEDTTGTELHNVFVDNNQVQDGNEINKYDKASYESSGKDNLLANVKLFIATLPVDGGVDPYTMMHNTTEFSESYSKLMKDLYDTTSFEDIIRRLETKRGDDFYRILLDGAPDKGRIGLKNAPDSFKHQFEIAVSKHRHIFNNIVVDKEGNHTFVEAAVSKAEKELAYEWSLNFYLSGKFITVDDQINTKALKSRVDLFNAKIKRPIDLEYGKGRGVIKNYDDYLNKISLLLNDLGINISEKDVQNAIDILGRDSKGNENKHLGMNNLVNQVLDGLFGKAEGALIKMSGELKEGVKPESLIANDNKIKELASLVLEGNIYLLDDTVLGARNNTYYVYAQSSLLTDYTKDLKKGTELFKGLQSVVYNKNSRFIDQIAKGKKFELLTFASYRNEGYDANDYKQINDLQDFLLKLNAVYKGYIPMPTLADRKAYYFYKGLDPISLDEAYLDNGKYTMPNSVVDVFYGYAEDMQGRVAKVEQEIEEAIITKNYSKLIQNKHYKDIKGNNTPVLQVNVDGKKVSITKLAKGSNEYNKYYPEGLKYQHFTDFNNSEINKPAIKKALRSNTINTLEYAASLGAIQINKNKEGKIIGIVNKKLGNKLVDSYTSKFGNTTDAIFHLMAEYTVNSISSTIETEKLVSGDPAYYKSLEDKIKRLNAPVAPGDKLIEDLDEAEFKGKRTYNTAIIQSFIYEDKILVEQLRGAFTGMYKQENPDATDKEVSENIELRLEPYRKVDVTDAQVYVTPQMYRELKKRMGEWEDSFEEAYKIVMNPEITDKESLLKATNLVMQPLKLVHFGQYFDNGAGIPIYDKMSVAVLLPSLVKGTEMQPMYDMMQSDKIDMLKYDSAVKVGNTGSIEYFDKNGKAKVENLDNMTVTSQRFKYLRKQQPTDPHVTEARKLGTQVKKVVMANLKLDKQIYTIKGSNKKYTGKQIADMFSNAYSAMSNTGKEKVNKSLGVDSAGNIDSRKLYDNLRNDAIQSNMPYNIIDSLNVDENGIPDVHLDTLLNRRWTESRMISSVTKKTIDTIVPGTDLIQMSGGGLDTSEDLSLKLMDDKGRTEIKISVSTFKSVIPNYDGKTYDEKIKWLDKNVKAGYEGIGYRIPTQGQNSTIAFVIKEWLPESYGNTIVLPYSFTALTGSDFDIDKLFIARYNYYERLDKIHRYKFYEGDTDGIMNDDEVLKEIHTETIYPKLDFRDRLIAIRNQVDATVADEWFSKLDEKDQVLFAEELDLDSITQEVLEELGSKLTYDELNEAIKKLEEVPSLEEFIKANKGKKDFDINHPKAVQNRLLDIMFSVLTNDNHILETKTPLDTFTEKLRKMSEVVKDKTPLGMLEGAAPAYQLQVKNWYVGGGKGIGPFALNNVHHALTQIVDYSIGGYDISKQTGEDGVAIIDWLSALINANVDIAKDPYIFHLNVNEDTYNQVNFLIRAGFGEQSFWMVNQPSVKLMKGTPKEVSGVLMQKAQDLLPKSLNKEERESKVRELERIMHEYSELDTVMADRSLESYINQKEKDSIYYAKQAGIILAYESMTVTADKLAKTVNLSRIDNKGFGNTLADLRKFDKDVVAHMKQDEGYADILNETFLGAMYKNTVPFMLELYSGLTIDSTKGYNDIIDRLDDKFVNIGTSVINNAVYSAIVSLYFTSPNGANLNKEKISKLFKGDTSVGYRVRNLTNTYPELKANKIIDTFKPVFDRTDNVWFMKSISGDKNDKFLRDSYSDDWSALLEHTDPDVRKLAEDFISYSFYTSGFNRSLYSFYQDLPISKLKDRPKDGRPAEAVRSFDEFIGDTIKMLNSETLSEEYKNYIEGEALKILNIDKIDDAPVPPSLRTIDNKPALVQFMPSKDLEYGVNIEGQKIYPKYYKYNFAQEGTLAFEFQGYVASTGMVIYSVVPQSGIYYRGHKVLEIGYEGSITDNDYTKLDKEYFATILPSTEGYTDFVYVEDQTVYESIEEAEASEIKVDPIKDDVVGTQLDLFDGLTNVQKAQLQSVPEEFRSDENIRNAIINGDRAEVESVLNKLKEC